MRITHKRRFAAVAATTAAVLVGGGIAVAYWTTTGTGTGTATTGNSSTVTVTPDNVPAGLYPGGPAQDIDFSISNSNASAQYITTVAVAVTGTSDANCDADNFTVTQPTMGVSVPSGGASYLGSATGATIAMDETGVNQDDCKDVTVNLSYTAS